MVTAYYCFSSGLPGFLPDYQSGAMAFSTRRELAAAVRRELEMLDYPVTLFNVLKIRDLWRFIVKAKSASCAYASLRHRDRVFCLHGLTKDEYLADKESEQQAAKPLPAQKRED
jgi:hypothetical protein